MKSISEGAIEYILIRWSSGSTCRNDVSAEVQLYIHIRRFNLDVCYIGWLT